MVVIERNEAIQRIDQAGISGLPRRCAPRNDKLISGSLILQSTGPTRKAAQAGNFER
jgi:hypothetical protein